jgi:hypothetical protein
MFVGAAEKFLRHQHLARKRRTFQEGSLRVSAPRRHSALWQFWQRPPGRVVSIHAAEFVRFPSCRNFHRAVCQLHICFPMQVVLPALSAHESQRWVKRTSSASLVWAAAMSFNPYAHEIPLPLRQHRHVMRRRAGPENSVRPRCNALAPLRTAHGRFARR